MSSLTTCLWFDGRAEEAANFYVATFKNSHIDHVSGPAGSVLMVQFTLDGQGFSALNGGPQYRFNPAISFVIPCANQAEVDDYWAKLTADGGAEVRCGWLTDKFGVSWQIVPSVLPSLIGGPDAAGAKRAMAAMMQMKKLDIAALEQAYHAISL